MVQEEIATYDEATKVVFDISFAIMNLIDLVLV